MANREFLYFYAPTWDFPPDGPIKLGNVLHSVKTPHRPLAGSPPLSGLQSFKTEKRSVRYTKEKLRSGRFSILTKFLSFVGLGADICAEVRNRDEEIFLFESVETTQITLTTEYLQECIENDDVRRFLDMSRYRKPIYVITGLKIVTGAQANTHQLLTISAETAAKVDGTVWTGGTAPISGSARVDVKIREEGNTSWEGSSDFVFAFRVSKVTVGKSTGQVVNEVEYRKGTMLGNETEGLKSTSLCVIKVEEADGKMEGFDTEVLMEDEELVVCAIPKKQDGDDDEN